MGCIEDEYKAVTHTLVVMLTVSNKGQSSSDNYTNKRNQGKMDLIVKIQNNKRTHAITILTITIML